MGGGKGTDLTVGYEPGMIPEILNMHPSQAWLIMAVTSGKGALVSVYLPTNKELFQYFRKIYMAIQTYTAGLSQFVLDAS